MARAAAIATYNFQSVLALSVKGTNGDIVTNIDIACEVEMVRLIKNTFPDHSIVVEEMEDNNIDGSSWKWVVDPLDGTNNYAYALPIFGVSVALCYENTPILACLAEGLRYSLITAVTGKGVTIGREHWSLPHHSSQRPSCAFWVGYEIDRNGKECLGLISMLSRLTRRTFENWAPVVDVGLYLRGGLDVVLGLGCTGTEIPAALLVLREAGARIADPDGVDVNLACVPRIFVAGRSPVVDLVLTELQSVLPFESRRSRARDD